MSELDTKEKGKEKFKCQPRSILIIGENAFMMCSLGHSCVVKADSVSLVSP